MNDKIIIDLQVTLSLASNELYLNVPVRSLTDFGIF